MLFLKFILLAIGFGAFGCVAAMIGYDVYLAFELSRLLRQKENAMTSASGESASTTDQPGMRKPLRARPTIRWQVAGKLATVGSISCLLGLSIAVVPDGTAAVRVSQIWGVRPGALYPGTHFILPLTDHLEMYDTREKVFSTAAIENSKEKLEVLTVEAKEGLPIGLAVTVRYRIDPKRLDYIHANLAQPIDDEVVKPVVLSAFHQMAPNYTVREVFSSKREDFRTRAAQAITSRLAGDGINVKEVLLKRVDLPEEYAKGLENLLMKEQDDDQTSVEADIEQKRVKIAESQAEAAKVREVKRAEADAAARVIMAKADSDSMQYTLPLKQKQIEQSRLEAEARKEATIQNADAEAQAKVIDSKAEQQRQNLLADSEANRVQVMAKAEQQRQNLLAESDANRIRVTSEAHAEELQLEAAALKSNPLLVQYTVAQKLSDKVQIMLVPNDGKFFFTNDVLKTMGATMDGQSPVASVQPVPNGMTKR